MSDVMPQLSSARDDARALEEKLRGIADSLWDDRRGMPHPAYGAVRRAESLAGAARTDTESAIADVILQNAVGGLEEEL